MRADKSTTLINSFKEETVIAIMHHQLCFQESFGQILGCLSLYLGIKFGFGQEKILHYLKGRRENIRLGEN